jgi:PLP dependent protein
MAAIAESLAAVRARIADAARLAGRNPTDIDLIAVSKTQAGDAIRAALLAGQVAFGENRVQEAERKFPPLRGQFPGLRLHLIGPLQTNKAGDAVRLFDVIETVDRPKLAAALAASMDRLGRRIPCLVQVNTGQEAQKAGVAPERAAAFIDECRTRHRLPIEGLMCIPPVDEPPAGHFALLRDLAYRAGLQHLSMGMSGDFEIAIAQGATSVRVGTAIFGARTTGPSEADPSR